MRVAVDIDEVLCPFFHPMIKRAGYKVPKAPHPYIYRKALGISEKESSDMVRDFYDSKKFKKLKPLSHAQFGIYNLIGKGYKLYAVTGRQQVARELTEEWLDTFFPNAFHDLVTTNSFTEDEVSKVKICKSLNLSSIIDDNFDICKECKIQGIDSVHFIGNPTYAWCHQRNPLIPRASSWLEVLSEFPVVEHPKTLSGTDYTYPSE